MELATLIIPLVLKEGVPLVVELLKLWKKEPAADPGLDAWITLLSGPLSKSYNDYIAEAKAKV